MSSNEGFHITKNHFVIDGFIVMGGAFTADNASLGFAGFNITAGVMGTVVRNNIIHHIGRTACSVSTNGFVGMFANNAPSTIFENNLVYAIGRLRVGENGCAKSVPNDRNDHGVYIHGGSIEIRNNIFYDNNRGYPIQFSSGGSDTISSFAINNNTIDGRSPTGVPRAQVEISSAIGSGTITNNNFSNPETCVFDIGGTYSVSGSITYDYNLTDLADADMVCQAKPATMINGGHNKINTSPGFVNISTHDYHLAAGSAAIDHGTTVSTVITDKDGVARPIGGAYDIGAYEVVGGSDSSPPSAPIGLNVK